MADPEQAAEGATTVPPPPDPAAARDPVPAPVLRAARPLPAAAPASTSLPRLPRRPRGWWFRQALPVFGFALFVSCLGALLKSLPDRANVPGPGAHPAIRPQAGWGGGLFAVVLDAGHGGVDTGAIASGLQEKMLTLDVAQRVGQALESRGYPVRMTRTADVAVSLEERVRIANATPGAIFVSVHFNDAVAGERGQSYHASGVETFYCEHKESGGAGDWLWTSLFGGRGSGSVSEREALAWAENEGALLAESIQGSLVDATSAADRGIKERALYVTRRVRAPAVLVEGGFISHPVEAKRLGDPAYRQKLADAVAAGIIRYLKTTGRGQAPTAGGNAATGA